MMEENKFSILQANETCALIEFEDKIDKEINKRIRILCSYLDENPFCGLVEYIPYFCSVSVIYNPIEVKGNEPFKVVESKLKEILSKLDFSCSYKENVIEIPVCYGSELGPDIEYVAEHNKLTVDEVINIHSNGEYLVYMLGFAPGFPYLGGLSEKLHTPRRDAPRTAIPAGSVGIAGTQTGIYPLETPGGWQIIGRTPLKLFDFNGSNKTLLKCGDIARFHPISYAEYLRLKERV